MPTQFFLEQIAEERESWKDDHAQAMRCRELEDLIFVGTGLYYQIRMFDKAWSRKVQAGVAKYDPEIASFIHKQYNWWLRPCEAVNRAIQLMEPNFEVEGAEEFRRCWRVAKNYASIDSEALIESALQAERNEFVEVTEEDFGPPQRLLGQVRISLPHV